MTTFPVDNLDAANMRKAIRLALKGLGRTAPNPMVGAVVVKRGRMIGSGYHERAGLAHAEVVALDNALVGLKGRRSGGPRGANLYVTLEPCPVFGRTPPCTDAIIEAGIRRVFIGAGDPNPKVRGRGVRILRRAGIEVVTGVLKAECEEINHAYSKHIVSGMPFVTLKLAASLDGRIAVKGGDSKWITSKESRSYVHKLRDAVNCVMVGSGTALADDPRLTVRGVKNGQSPMRALVDSSLKISPDAKIFKGAKKSRVFVFTGKKSSEKKVERLRKLGAEVIMVRATKAGLSLRAVLTELGKRGVTDLLVEGGGTLGAGLLSAGLVDKLLWFSAPLIIGGDGVASIAPLGAKKMAETIRLKDVKIKTLGGDILIEGCF